MLSKDTNIFQASWSTFFLIRQTWKVLYTVVVVHTYTHMHMESVVLK